MATQNYIDKIILEASARFEEKLNNARDGQMANLGTSSSLDRTYNLRNQIQYVPQLQQDKHFMTMVSDVDKYTSPEWTLRGDVEKRLYSVLAGFLKGLLRECISSNDAAFRKINIEKSWNWYRDQKKRLVEWKMDKREGIPQGNETLMYHQKHKGEDILDGMEDDADKRRTFDDLAPKLSDAQLKRQHQLGMPDQHNRSKLLEKVKARIEGAQLDLNFMKQEEEQQRATDIVKKLQLYQKRNLQKSLEMRLEMGRTLSTDGGPEQTRPPSAGAPMSDPMSTMPRIVYRDKAKPKADEPKAAPILMHATDGPESQSPESLKHNSEYQNALATLEKVWIQKRAQEAEAKLEAMEFADTVTMWSYNQSRIEEEMNRRQEANQMSSQTGKTCHKNLRRPVTAPGAADDCGGSDMSLMGPQREGPNGEIIIGPNKYGFGETFRSSTAAAKVISLSPYDNYIPGKDGTHMRLLTMFKSSSIATPDDRHRSTMVTQGLSQTHPTAIRGTSLMNSQLDINSSPGTTFAPSMVAGIGRLPMRPAADTEEEAAATGKASPRKAAGSPGAKVSKRRGPIDPRMLEQIFPVLSVEQDVPSIMRMKQMQQVETIRETFAKYGMTVPTSIIENAILTPEDRPYLECMLDLPPPDSGIVNDFTKKQDKPRAKAGKAPKNKPTTAD